MAAPFTVNINISAGADFTQQFTAKTADQSPMDITGCTFLAKLAKHPTALDATTSTSGVPVYNFITLDTSVVDGTAGIYSISMNAAKTSLLPEGKYLYSVVMQNTSGEKSPAVDGVAFVDVAFGALS